MFRQINPASYFYFLEHCENDSQLYTIDPIQSKFIEKYAFQCGFCTPGIIMALKGLFLKNPHPSEAAIKEALSGNQCRCISQYHVFDAAAELAEEIARDIA
jgi:carbon-monoxide dehydrogenase small subunit